MSHEGAFSKQRRHPLRIAVVVLMLNLTAGACHAGEMHDAASNGQVHEILDIVLRSGNVNLVDDRQGYTGLHFAARYGDASLAQALLDAGADPNIEDKYGKLPIEFSVYDILTWNKEFIRKETTGMGTTRLWQKDVFNLLVDSGSRIREDRLLLEAVISNDPSLLDELQTRWNAKIPDGDGRYVYNAVVRGAIESLKWLIDKGAELNQPQTNDFTPLHIAAKNGNIEILRILLNAGAYQSINARDSSGRTPAQVARNGRVAAILANAVPPDTLIAAFAEDTKNSCLKIEGLRPEQQGTRTGVYGFNASMSFYRSRYNTRGIEFEAGDGGGGSNGGLPGGGGHKSEYRFIGAITVTTSDGQTFVFDGSPRDPISFVLTNEDGLVYLNGSGSVILADGQRVELPCS